MDSPSAGKRPRIAYFGLPLGALALARDGAHLVTVCIGHTDAPGMWRVRRTLGRDALVLGRPRVEASEVLTALASARPDAVLSWFWPFRLPEAALTLGRLGAYGVHPSLLPRWRGPDPYFWALRSGDATTGVTLHALDREYDTGAIIAQRTIDIAATDDAWSLARKLDRPGLELLLHAARSLHDGPLLGTPQASSGVPLAPSPSAADLTIAWKQRAEDVVRLVRAAAPRPGAVATLGALEVEVLAAEISTAKLLRVLEPAEAVAAPGGVLVRCAEGGVLVTAARIADDGGSIVRGDALHALLAP